MAVIAKVVMTGRLIKSCDIWIVLLEYVEAFQGFGIPAETKQHLALLRGLKMLRQTLRCDRFVLLGRGPALLSIHQFAAAVLAGSTERDRSVPLR